MSEPTRCPDFVALDELPPGHEVIGVPVWSDLSSPAGAGPTPSEAYMSQRRFEGKPGDALACPGPEGSVVVALGVGERGRADADVVRRAAAALARSVGRASQVATTLLAAASPELSFAVAEGFGLAAYRYESAPARVEAPRVERVSVVGADPALLRRGAVAAEETCRARDWVNRPARQLTPRALAEQSASAAERFGVSAEIWDEQRIASEGLGGLAGVSAGAEEPPRLIHLCWDPPGASAHLALVGKGITFDSGGLSLKPAAGMMTMKDDMGGAAAVICATLAAARLELGVKVETWVAATENMPGGRAIHPGDVLVARNGKTMEVLNTDAEGRLVLADALSLAAEARPDAIVDVATLTGGQRVALGDKVAALMGSDPALVSRVLAAAARAGEPAWELPLYAPYRRQLDSEVADMKNVAANNGASSIMAALFLAEFHAEVPWAHLDIAGPAWSESDEAWTPKGGTGWATRTLIELALDLAGQVAAPEGRAQAPAGGEAA